MVPMRTRFAPSPTGNVHIGNIRVAIFNWLAARHAGGQFLIRIEDTDLERSTPEAIQKLFQSLEWLGLDYDGEPMYQTKERPRHEQAARAMLAAGVAAQPEANGPIFLRICKELLDESFVTAPREDAHIQWKDGTLTASAETITHVTTSPKSGETFTTPVNWDALTAPRFLLEDGRELDASAVRAKLGSEPQELNSAVGSRVIGVKFQRRYVYFDDLVLGRMEKPLDSLRNFIIARGDGSPIFHLANVIDDVTQQVTHILRGNDHVENTFRHLFIFKAYGATPPQYGHFPMIVNASGKPYSKRDGDAYVGDFRDKGILPDALFNFLALCGWAPGDDREVMTRAEMMQAFSLDRVNASAAQFDLKKLDWMNQQYIMQLPQEKLEALLAAELNKHGIDAAKQDKAWFSKLVGTQRERISKTADFIANTYYFFSDSFTYDEKAVKKNLQKNEGEGLKALAKAQAALTALPDWTDEAIEGVVHKLAEEYEGKMGVIAQPLRIACTGGTVSPGIGETLFLIGREQTLARIARALASIPAA